MLRPALATPKRAADDLGRSELTMSRVNFPAGGNDLRQKCGAKRKWAKPWSNHSFTQIQYTIT
jgi:hypothetical protein